MIDCGSAHSNDLAIDLAPEKDWYDQELKRYEFDESLRHLPQLFIAV